MTSPPISRAASPAFNSRIPDIADAAVNVARECKHLFMNNVSSGARRGFE
jgi:hypothetical protein